MKSLAIIIAMASIAGINLWASDRDNELMRSSVLYEQCVKSQYHMTPTQWYETHHRAYAVVRDAPPIPSMRQLTAWTVLLALAHLSSINLT